MQKQQAKKIGIFIGCMLLPGCWSGWQEPEQANDNNLVVINVLDQDFYNDCHIKGSVNVTLDAIEQFSTTLDKNTEIVVYCSNYQCSTSEYAAKKLKSLGHNGVYVYEGGIAEWYQKGLPVEGPSKTAYLAKRVSEPVSQQGEIPAINVEDLAYKMKIKMVCV